MKPTEVPHRWGGWRTFAELMEKLPGLFLGSLVGDGAQRSPGAVCHGETGHVDAVGYRE